MKTRTKWQEEEENEMESRANNKRKSRSPIEGENQNKSKKFPENQGEMCSGIENNNGRISVTINPDTLDCFNCCKPLRPPLFQCENGHVACSVCCTKLSQNKCPACSRPINFARCRLLEKIIESIKSPCCYFERGCNKTLRYIDISSHQENCIHAPCFCPMPSCFFSGSPEQVSTHFHDHQRSVGYQYGLHHDIYLDKEPFYALPIQNGLLFLVLNEIHDNGNALSVVCIRPSSMEGDFNYELTVRVNAGGRSLQLKAYVVDVRKWEGVYPSENFLLVPKNFDSSRPGNIITVCIKEGLNYSFYSE